MAVDAGGVPPAVEPTVLSHTAMPSLLTEAAPTPAATAPPATETPTVVVVEPSPTDAAAPATVETPAPAAPAPAATAPPIAAPAPEPIVYDPFEPPAGITLNAERLAAIDERLAAARVQPELRDELYNEHIAEMQRLQTHMEQEQHRVFGEVRRTEREKVMADPELWRPGVELKDQPALGAIRQLVEQFVSPKNQTDFWNWVEITGSGDFYAPMRMLYDISKKLSAPASPQAPAGPAPDRGRNPSGSRLRDYYDRTPKRA